MDTSTLRPASGQVNSPTALARTHFQGGFIETARFVAVETATDHHSVLLVGSRAEIESRATHQEGIQRRPPPGVFRCSLCARNQCVLHALGPAERLAA